MIEKLKLKKFSLKLDFLLNIIFTMTSTSKLTNVNKSIKVRMRFIKMQNAFGVTIGYNTKSIEGGHNR